MKTAISLILILFAAFSSFAQETEISKYDFNRAMGVGLTAYYGKSYRRTTTSNSETTVQGKPVKSGSAKIVEEHASGMMYSKALYFSPQSKTRSQELFRPNSEFYYMRLNEGEWIKQNNYTQEDDDKWSEKREEASVSEKYGSTLLEDQRVYRKAIEIQNNQQISVLGFSSNTKFRSDRDNTEYTRIGTYKWWYAPDGRVLKTEDKFTTTRPNGEITNTLITTVYVLDPNIKIEVPVVKQ